MFPNLVTNDYKLHVVVIGVVTFWLISTNEGRNMAKFNVLQAKPSGDGRK
jgi:hypothetical protein